MRRVAPNYAFLAAAGFALVAFAASLTTIIEQGIKADVRAAVVVDTYRAWHAKHVNVRRPCTVHAWNVTNLKAVLDGAKPQLDKVDVALTRAEEGSDLKWLDGGDAYEFTRRSAYVARDAAEEARLDTEVVGLNPAYLATIAKYGSEGAMLRNLSHVAVNKVAEVLDAFITTQRLASVSTYLNGVAVDLLATGLALDGTAVWSSVESVARQWAGGAVLGGPLSSLDEKYTTFEASGVSEETALMLWDESHQYSLLTEAGVSAWTAALSGDGAAEIAAAVPESSAVLSWLSALVDETNPYYFAYVAPMLSDEAATSWRDLRGQQFATGAVTQKLYGVASVLSLQLDGVVVAPELPVYAAASGVTISMTAAEANAFLDTGSLPSSATADAYLNQYLPYDFLLKGFVVGYLRDGMTATTDPTGLDAASLTLSGDGTGTKNGGIFTRRTLREVVYGYEDPLLELLGKASYAGALNATMMTGRYGFRTGKRHISDVGKYALWRDTTNIEAIGLRKAQAKPFSEKGSITVWFDELLRPITFRSGAKTTVKDVEARNYHLQSFGMLTMPAGPSMTRPALGGLDEAYRSEFEGLPTYDAAEHGTWAAVEPLTGRFVKSHTRLEHAWSLDSTQLDCELWQHVFARMAAFPWPQLYTDESDEISGKDAKEFVAMVYGARDQAVIWAVIIGFLGLGLVFVGLHGISQDDDKAKTQVWPSPQREQRRPQHGKVEEDLFVEEVKEDPGEEYDDFPVPEEEEPEPARKTMTMMVVHWLPTPYNYKRY
ncbi:unnamed protein product [Pelagomonas calceolata]|uniref:Uncharacterized protein n=1 Tax=Pelagomonas calceolata TaxID=35677 RepID=A0A7S4EDZ1_9STRA|nr:unnamed protein product [Pelagomonas calceolata]